MSIFNDDTKQLMARDVDDFKKKQQELHIKLGEALTGYPDSMIHSALTNALSYGFRMPNSKWHPAPLRNSSRIIIEGLDQ